MTFESPRNSFSRIDHVCFDVVAAAIREKIVSWTACWIVNIVLASWTASTKSHISCDLSKVFILMLHHSYFSPLKIGNNGAKEEKLATAIFVL